MSRSYKLLTPADGATFCLYAGPVHGPTQLTTEAAEWAGALQGGGRYVIKVKPEGVEVRDTLKVTFE